MGICASSGKCEPFGDEKDPIKGVLLAERVKLMQKEITEIICSREKESRAYKKDLVRFEHRKAKWKKARKRLKEEVKRLTVVLEDREEKIRVMEAGSLWAEQAKDRNGEAGDKWKQLYLAIKTELDGLIERTYRGETVYWRAEQEALVEELRKEMKAKDDAIEVLRAQLTSAKQAESKKSREADILRQSLRIVSSNKSGKDR